MLFQEPVESEDDIIRFYEATGLPVALDETINSYRENHYELLSKYTHPGIVAFVSGSCYFLFTQTSLNGSIHCYKIRVHF